MTVVWKEELVTTYTVTVWCAARPPPGDAGGQPLWAVHLPSQSKV